MLCSMSVAALAAEPMTEADTVSTMISAADTLPGISAYPAEVRASEENGVYRLEKVYYLTAKDDPATIPTADFEREGRTYTLLDLLKNDQTETDTREHIEVVTLESKTKDMAEILKMLEPKLEVKTEDGYEGVLSLDHTTIQVEAVGYGTSSRTVTAERTYPNLSDADAEVHCEFADMGLPVTGGVALDMTDVFSGEHLGAQKDSFNPHIKSHDCRLFLCHLVKDNA